MASISLRMVSVPSRRSWIATSMKRGKLQIAYSHIMLTPFRLHHVYAPSTKDDCESLAATKDLPFIKLFEILLQVDPINGYMISQLKEFNSKKPVCVSKGHLELRLKLQSLTSALPSRNPCVTRSRKLLYIWFSLHSYHFHQLPSQLGGTALFCILELDAPFVHISYLISQPTSLWSY